MFQKCVQVSSSISLNLNTDIFVVTIAIAVVFTVVNTFGNVYGLSNQSSNNNPQTKAVDSEIVKFLNETIVRDVNIWPATSQVSSPVTSQEELQKSFEIFENERYERAKESARSYFCVPLFRIFTVKLTQRLRPTEYVAVTGDHASLGQWQLEKSLDLRPKNRERTRWGKKKWICAKQRIYYRYLVYERNAEGEKVLRYWEGQQPARMLQSYEISHKGVDVFGAAWSLSIGGGIQREYAWLRQEYVIELKFIWRRHIYWTADVTWNTGNYRLRLEQLQNRVDSLQNTAMIEVSRYAYNHSAFREQPTQGVSYENGRIIIFRITQALNIRNAFKLVIADMNAVPVGEVYILPIHLRGNTRLLQLPIYSIVNGFSIGELKLPILLVKPMPNVDQITLAASFQHYWPMNWPTMDVGHRGVGASYYHAGVSQVENTIASFLAAQKAMADMVEFDVQLTRDYVPILWHGFGFYTARPDQLISDPFDLEYVLIKDLTYEELKSARVFVNKRWQLQEYTHLNVKNVTFAERIFPTLAEVYQSLPITLGLIIDIKWPQLMDNGFMESVQFPNKNRYVNEILSITTKYGCGRALIFTSLDADICTMIRLKQPAFPAMLMTIGNSRIWDPYKDLRTQSFVQAVNFAESADILGTATHIDNFYQKPELVDLGLDLMQVVFIWGNDLKHNEFHEQFRFLEVSGLIYDQKQGKRPNWKSATFFDAMELIEIFGMQCVVIGNSTSIPGIKLPKPTIWPKQ